MPLSQPGDSYNTATPKTLRDWEARFRQAQADLLATTQAEITLAETILAESRAATSPS